MKTIYFAICVILVAPVLAQAQEKRPKTTLLHYSNPSQHYDYYYGPELISIPEMRAGSVGMMPPGCRYSFHRTIQRRWGVPQNQETFVAVNVACPCGTMRQLYLKLSDNDKRFAKCEEGDQLTFDGKFRVVANWNVHPGQPTYSVQAADNNASIFPAKKTPGPK